jgi:uncharacterized membrane protein YkvA (DUF1232 family)
MNFSIQSVYNWYRNAIRNPKYRWWVILGTALYFISPVDFLPDFIPFLGEFDDAILITLLISEVSQLALDKIKTRRANTNATNPSTVNPDTTANTVDVNAVSVK